IPPAPVSNTKSSVNQVSSYVAPRESVHHAKIFCAVSIVVMLPPRLCSERYRERDELAELYQVKNLLSGLRIIEHHLASVVDADEDMGCKIGARSRVDNEKLSGLCRQKRSLLVNPRDLDTRLRSNLCVCSLDSSEILCDMSTRRGQPTLANTVQESCHAV